MATFNARIRIRRGLASDFIFSNPTLANGEIAYETDTRNIKVGDGATAWTALGYINPYRGNADAPVSNTVLGSGAAAALQSGSSNNVAIGLRALDEGTTGSSNIAVGRDALGSLSTTSSNIAIGDRALFVYTGSESVGVGTGTLEASVSGNSNTALGHAALLSLTAGGANVAVGSRALVNHRGDGTVAVGANALSRNTLGSNNLAIGRQALEVATTQAATVTISAAGTGGTPGTYSAVQLTYVSGATATTYPTADIVVGAGGTVTSVTIVSGGSAFTASSGTVMTAASGSIGNTTGFTCTLATVASAASNTAVGHNAGLLVTTGTNNTLVGSLAGDAITTGRSITAIGSGAAGANTTGENNTAVGHSALLTNLTGSNNVAVGGSLNGGTLQNNKGSNNTAVGELSMLANTDGAQNTALGRAAFQNNTVGQHNVALGWFAARLQADGTTSLTDPEGCVYIGAECRGNDNNDSNAVVIAGRTATARGVGDGANTTVIGNAETTSTRIPAGNLTLTNGNFIVGTSGKGIDFGITTSGTGTMTSELLSDYEEGTWTPMYSPTTGSFTTLTMDVIGAKYVKVGSQVTVTAMMRTDNVDATGASGALRIEGLPFSTSSVGRGAGSLSGGGNWAGDTPMSVLVLESRTFLDLYYRDASDTQDLSVVVADMTTGATANQNSIYITCTYMT